MDKVAVPAMKWRFRPDGSIDAEYVYRANFGVFRTSRNEHKVVLRFDNVSSDEQLAQVREGREEPTAHQFAVSMEQAVEWANRVLAVVAKARATEG